jgi:hypothetical protein
MEIFVKLLGGTYLVLALSLTFGHFTEGRKRKHRDTAGFVAVAGLAVAFLLWFYLICTVKTSWGACLRWGWEWFTFDRIPAIAALVLLALFATLLRRR